MTKTLYCAIIDPKINYGTIVQKINSANEKDFDSFVIGLFDEGNTMMFQKKVGVYDQEHVINLGVIETLQPANKKIVKGLCKTRLYLYVNDIQREIVTYSFELVRPDLVFKELKYQNFLH